MNVSVQTESNLSLGRLLMLVFRQLKLEKGNGAEIRLNGVQGEFENFFREVKEEFQNDFPCLKKVHFVTTGATWSQELAEALDQLQVTREFRYEGGDMILRPLYSDAWQTQARNLERLGLQRRRFEELVKKFEEIKRRP